MEAYVSPAAFVPAWVKLGTGAALGAALWSYFVLRGVSPEPERVANARS